MYNVYLPISFRLIDEIECDLLYGKTIKENSKISHKSHQNHVFYCLSINNSKQQTFQIETCTFSTFA